MATNNTNVFATVKPLQGSVSDDIQQQEENGFRRRQEQRIEDEIAQRRIDKEQAKKDALREKMLGQIPKNYDTGSSSLNEFQAKIITQGANRLGQIYEELNKPNLTETDKVKLQIEAQNIENLPENLKIATDNFSQIIKDYKEGTEKGAFFKNPEFEKLVLSGFENYVGTLDNGLPTVGFIDTNKDGTIDIKDVQTYDNLSKGIGTWNFQKQFDLDKMASETAKGLKPQDITKVRGYKTVQEKSVPDSEIEFIAKNTLFQEDGTPKEALLSEFRKKGLEDTPENRASVEQYYRDRIKANTDKLYKEDFDYGAMNASQRLNYDKSKDDEKNKKATFDVVNTPPIFVQAKIKPADGYKTVAVTNSKPIPLIQGFNAKGEKREITNATIASYTVVKTGGNRKVVAEIVYQDSKSSTLSKEDELMLLDEKVSQDKKDLILSKVNKGAENKYEIITLSEKDGVKYAKDLGFDDYNEMKRTARTGEETPKETASERALRIANGG